MQEIIAVVFENELNANTGLRALRELDKTGDIVLFEARVLSKRANGSVDLVDSVDHLSLPIVGGGTVVGALVGLLAGPLGAIPGAGVGALLGTVADLKVTGVTDEFVAQVREALKPGTVAVIADLEEERFASPVDACMEPIGGVVVRQIRSIVKQSEEDTDLAAHQAEMEDLKATRARRKAAELEKIDARIDHLRGLVVQAIERKRARMRLHRQQRAAKIQELQKRAAQAQSEAQGREDAEVTELQQDYLDKAKAR